MLVRQRTFAAKYTFAENGGRTPIPRALGHKGMLFLVLASVTIFPLMPTRKLPDLSANTGQDDPAKIERFKALARELGCDEDEAAFEAALKKVADAGPAPGQDHLD